jgi:hypothetical protein
MTGDPSLPVRTTLKRISYWLDIYGKTAVPVFSWSMFWQMEPWHHFLKVT